MKTTKLQEAIIVHSHLSLLIHTGDLHINGDKSILHFPDVSIEVNANNLRKKGCLEFFNLG